MAKAACCFLLVLLVFLSSTAGMAQKVSWPSVSLEQFVSGAYAEGMPYAEARAYASDPSNVRKLVEMIRHSRPGKGAWMNAVVVLGAIGDETVAPILISELEKDHKAFFLFRPFRSERSKQLACAEQRYALQAMGLLVNTTGSSEALGYLIGGTDPRWWTGRIKWKCGKNFGQEDLSEVAVEGLALSGNDLAAAHLDKLRRTSPLKESRDFAEQAFEHNRKIAVVGLAAYLGHE